MNSYRKHKLYGVWLGMRTRCYNSKNGRYKWYGARGIKVCEEWHDSTTFIEWALANGWQQGLEIDRERNNEDYTPDNCRFVTKTVNNNNRRNNILVEIGGETITLTDAHRRYSVIKYRTVRDRFVNKGWSVMDALQTPLQKPGPRKL